MSRDRRMGAADTDESLVAAAQAGDRGALTKLLERHYDRVRAVCVRIAGSTRDGDDAAQEAMIRIVNNLSSFDGRSSFGTWTYRIATNAAIDELRRRQRRGRLSLVDDDEAPELVDPTSAEPIEAFESHLELADALRTLPEEFRTPVILRDVADLDYEQIAATLDVPLGTVKSRIARGRRMLREQLGNQTDLAERHSSQSSHSTPLPSPHFEP